MKKRRLRFTPLPGKVFDEVRRLEKEDKSFALMVKLRTEAIERCDASIKASSEGAARGNYHQAQLLAEKVEELKRLKSEREVFRQQAADRKREMRRLLNPTAEQKEKRREMQAALASDFEEIAALDGVILREVARIGDLVEKRDKLMERAQAHAGKIDFTRRLGGERFAALAAALPNDDASRDAWLDSLVGSGESLSEYRVIRDNITIRETLQHAGECKRGEIVRLSDEEAAALLADGAIEVTKTSRVRDGGVQPETVPAPVDMETRGQIVALQRIFGISADDAARKISGKGRAPGARSLSAMYEGIKATRGARVL